MERLREGPIGLFFLFLAPVWATVGIALASRIPSRHTGGDILESGVYNLLAGERVLSREEAEIYRTAISQSYSTVHNPVTHSRVIHIPHLTMKADSPREFVDKIRKLAIQLTSL